MEKFFTDVYENNNWGESKIGKDFNGSSGGGSLLEDNWPYINLIRDFIQQNKINSVVDLGCGDWQFSNEIYRELNVDYTGYDCYKKMIESHKKNHVQYNFEHLDIYEERTRLKTADLYIIKDVLQHWLNEEIITFFDWIIVNKKCRYLIINNSCAQKYDNQETPSRSRPLSGKFLPLKKYDPEIVLKYIDKEVSVIKIY